MPRGAGRADFSDNSAVHDRPCGRSQDCARRRVFDGGRRRRPRPHRGLVEERGRAGDCLVSFGIAGGLAPELRAGDVVLSTEVLSDRRSRWQPDERLPRSCRRAGGRDRRYRRAGAWRRADVLATEADKRRAWPETGALAVDLESAVVARIAARAGIPFLVAARDRRPGVRATCRRRRWSRSPRTERRKLVQVLASVLRRPQQLAALFGLARETRPALAALVAARPRSARARSPAA